MSRVDFLAVITARSGSKSILHKNLQKVSGRSLLEWTAAAISRTPGLEHSLISTDSNEYAKAVQSYGVLYPFQRPKEISSDKSVDADVFRHLSDWLISQKSLPSYFVHFRPTTPFREPKVLHEALEFFLNNSENYTAMRSVHEMSESAYKCFEINRGNQLVKVFSRESHIDSSNNPKEAFPRTFFPNGYIDVIKVDYFLDTGLLHGDNVLAFRTEPALEIDSTQELEFARLIAERNPNLHDRLFI